MNVASLTSRSPYFCLVIFFVLALPNSLFSYTKSGKSYITDGSQSDLNAAILNASVGSIVNIPAGAFTWGANNVGTVINKAITVAGAGQGATKITSSSGSSGLFYIQGAATLKSMTINQVNGQRLISITGADGWRLTDLCLNGAASGRILDISTAYGLIDHCTIWWYSEQIFIVGKSGSWNSAHTMGSSNAVYFEDNIFNGTGQGYTDGNGDAKVVYRFNTLNSAAKFDAHGIWSDSPRDSSRQFEAYYNTWTPIGIGGAWTTMEWRGGTGMAFFNTTLDNTNVIRGSFKIQEYGATSIGGYWGNNFQGPDNYPVYRQLGRGTSQGSEPCYFFGNTRQAAYGSTKATSMAFITGTIPQAAIDQYRARSGNSTATYTHEDIVRRDHDYFTDMPVSVGASTPLNTFTGSDGVGIGTKARMLAITPSKIGVGFWVTDEGSWNTTHTANTSGPLYTWNGNAWTLMYTPYTYPHPLAARPNAPTGLRIQ